MKVVESVSLHKEEKERKNLLNVEQEKSKDSIKLERFFFVLNLKRKFVMRVSKSRKKKIPASTIKNISTLDFQLSRAWTLHICLQKNEKDTILTKETNF